MPTETTWTFPGVVNENESHYTESMDAFRHLDALVAPRLARVVAHRVVFAAAAIASGDGRRAAPRRSALPWRALLQSCLAAARQSPADRVDAHLAKLEA